MTYKQFTIRSHDQQTEHQWVGRAQERDLALAERRNLGDLLECYLPKDGAVLEAGCGIGGWMQWLARHGWSQVIGVDYFPAIIEAAHGADPTLNVEVGDVTRLRWPDGYFAGYISLGVIEHFEEGPQLALREALRVLRPGGIAIITVPGETLVRRLLSHPMRSVAIAALRTMGRPTHFAEYRYDLKTLVGLIRDAGFEIIHTDVDEVRNSELEYHVGLYCDFPFLRGGEGTGSMKLNAMGRLVRRLTRSLDRHVASGVFVAARKPGKQGES